MQQELSQNYCEHFQNLKSIKKITLDQNPFCKFCMSTNCPLWICLHVKHLSFRKIVVLSYVENLITLIYQLILKVCINRN